MLSRDTQLAAEDQNLGTELGVGAGPDQDEVDDEEEQLVDDAEKHAVGACPTASTIRGHRPADPHRGLPRATSKAPNRTDAAFTPQGQRARSSSQVLASALPHQRSLNNADPDRPQ